MSENKYSTSFIPKRVLIYKFSNYKGETPSEIYFDSFTGILGDTGAGKSSIIDAITFPIWKTTPRLKGSGVKIEDCCQIGGFCEVEFEKNSSLYIVRRGRDKNGLSFVILTINGVRYPESMPSKVDDKIREIVTIDYDSFAMTGYIAQDEVKEIINKTNSERLNTFKDIFKLDVFDDALSITSDRLKDIENRISNLNGQLNEKKLFVESNSNIVTLISEKESLIPSIENKMTDLENSINSKKKEKIVHQKNHELFLSFSSAIESYDREMNSLDKELSSQISRLRILIESKKTMIIESQSNLSIDALQQKLDLIQKRNNLCNVTQSYQRQYDQIEKSYNDKKEKINLKYTLYDISGIDALKEYKINDSISAEYVYDVIKGETINSIYSDIDKDFSDQTSSLLSQIELNREEIKKLNDVIENDNEESIKKLISKISKQKEDIIQFSTKIEELTNSVEEKKEKIKAIQAKKSQFSIEVEKYRLSNDEYNSIDTMLESMNKEFSSINGEKQMIVGELHQLKLRMKDVNAKKDEIIAMEKSLSSCIDQRTILDVIKKSVFSKKGMPIFALRSILSDIEYKASEIAKFLTQHREPAIKKDGTQNRIYKISLIPKGSGIEIEVDGVNARRYSGGEKTIISIAIRIALSQQLMEMSSLASSFRVLIIDEGDLRSLDDRTINSFITLLQNYENVFDTIILITHIDGATDGFNQIIRVEKDADTGYSTIVV